MDALFNKCQNGYAKILQEKSKGKIQKGYDADLVVWNDKKQFTVTEGSILHRHKITPYLGETLYGVVEKAWLCGEKVFDKVHITPGKGRVVYR
jgi:allantoinase